uniref:Putative secreted protein n=1 Tax=Amblyomma triste TaxID=251400 RepID=A0A023G4X3_AMBTT
MLRLRTSWMTHLLACVSANLDQSTRTCSIVSFSAMSRESSRRNVTFSAESQESKMNSHTILFISTVSTTNRKLAAPNRNFHKHSVRTGMENRATKRGLTDASPVRRLRSGSPQPLNSTSNSAAAPSQVMTQCLNYDVVEDFLRQVQS